MTFGRFSRERRFPQRPMGAAWLIFGAIMLLFICGCTGLFLHAVTSGGGDKSGSKAATAQPVVPANSPGGVNPSATKHVMPNVVGVRLTEAEKRLKAAGFTKIHSTDASGKRRLVVDHDNWVVRIQQPAVGAPGSDDTQVNLQVTKPTDTATTAPASTGVVPNVVCRDLQTAQDALQAAGFYVLSSQDGTGKGRHQILDRNWVVTAQSAAAGTRPKLSTRITLTVVKFGEPTNGCPT
jgi:beta-lactam-binding protein with PASTA domain